MKAFRLPETPLNFQKCLLPDSVFVQNYSGRFCLFTHREKKQKFLVKIGLLEWKTAVGLCLFDDSVSCLDSNLNLKTRISSSFDISLSDFHVLKKPVITKRVSVTVVFSDVFDMKNFRERPTDFTQILYQILRMFTLCNKSVVMLSNFNGIGNFGIECIIITSSDVESDIQPFDVNMETEIKIENSMTMLKFTQIHLTREQNVLVGCSNAYEMLREAVEFGCLPSQRFSQNRKILLIGAKGCGKTSLVYNVAFDCKCILLDMSAQDGEKEMKNVFEKAKLYSNYGETCIILIKNLDLICDRKKSNKCFRGLIAFLDDIEQMNRILVVATTSCLQNVDMELRKHKRFQEEVEIMAPGLDERGKILTQMLAKWSITCDETVIKNFAKLTPGFVGADLKLLVTESLLFFHRTQNSGEGKNMEIGLELERCLKYALTKVVPSGLRGEIGVWAGDEMAFEDVGGLESVKRSLDLSVVQQLEHPWKFHRLGVPLTKGILLYGPPGCAKTTLAKALARESRARFLATSAAELYSPYVGDAEKKVVQIFTQARMCSPAIIFIDEIDAVVGSKDGDRERGVQERILSTLLVEMDGVGLKRAEGTPKDSSNGGVIVIGATNHPQALDDALKRPGRFDKLVYVPPPDLKDRLFILRKLTQKMALADSVNLHHLAELTAFYSGADLKNLCREAGLYALNSTNMAATQVDQSHFEHVIKDLKPSLNQKIISFYESFQRFNQ